MKKTWIEYIKDWKSVPMAFWVHRPISSDWIGADTFNPQAPKPNENGLYQCLVVEFRGVTLRFTSRHQVSEFIGILSQKLLPTTRKLSQEIGAQVGPNSHWLSRLPSTLKPYKVRSELVEYLRNQDQDDIWS